MRRVTWIEPIASDLSNNVAVMKSLAPGAYIIGTTLVTYTFTDSSGNIAYCNFYKSLVFVSMIYAD